MIRRAAAADAPAITGLLTQAFGPEEGPTVAALVSALRGHPCGRDHLEWVVDEAGAVVGHTMVTRSRLDTLTATIDVAVLSPLAVAATHQGRGLGRALVAQAAAGAEEAGLPVLFLEGDPEFYSRLGLVPGKPLGFRKPSIRVPDAAFQVMLLAAYEPWMTGTLVYAEPFWDLDCVGLRDPAFLAWLADEVREGREL